MKKSHQLINQNSNQVERYTPRDIIRAEIALMGHIDLDPACSDEAYEYHNGHAKKTLLNPGLGASFLWKRPPKPPVRINYVQVDLKTDQRVQGWRSSPGVHNHVQLYRNEVGAIANALPPILL